MREQKDDLRKILEDALQASHNAALKEKESAGAYIKEGYSGDISTQADLDIEKAIIGSLKKSGISAEIISEEAGHVTINTNPNSSPECLIAIDPLDGSNNFSHGRGLMPYSTTIAIFSRAMKPRFKDIITAGTIEHTRGDTWVAEKGTGATLNSRQCVPSKKTTIDSKGKYIVDMFYDINWTTFKRLHENKEKINIQDLGSAAFHYALLASGHVDAMMNATQKAHELAAGYLLAKESGAIITDLDGNPLDEKEYDFDSKYPVVAAATRELHNEILRMIRTEATLEILSDPALREEALTGKEQARQGKTKKLSDIKKEPGF